jgi:hypothetical protein
MQNQESETHSSSPAQLPVIPPSSDQTPALAASEAERMLAKWSNQTPTFVTNLDLAGEEGLVLITNASAGSDEMTAQAAKRVLWLRGFVLSVWDKLDAKTGEVLKLLGCTLVLQDGRLVGTTANAVLRCVNMIAKTRPAGDWSPCVPVIIEPHKGNEAGPWYSMRVLSKAQLDDLEQKAKPKA